MADVFGGDDAEKLFHAVAGRGGGEFLGHYFGDGNVGRMFRGAGELIEDIAFGDDAQEFHFARLVVPADQERADLVLDERDGDLGEGGFRADGADRMSFYL